jgi:choline monooxygenase
MTTVHDPTTIHDPTTTHLGPHDPALTQRGLDHVRAGTTDLAPSVLRVPLWYYRDEGNLDREMELLRTTPLALVPSARVPREHDFVVRSVLGTSVLVTRGADGVARAFLNYCRHRGARPADGCGNARRFTCPYHAWVYDAEGRLVGMPGAQGFDEVDRTTAGLVALPCEERHGMVWVVLTAGLPLDLDAHLGPLDAELAEWPLGAYHHHAVQDFESEVSWKAALEGFAESYHFPYVHGESLIGMNTLADVSVHEAFGRHQRVCFPYPWITSHDRASDEGNDGPSWEPIANMAVIYWIFPNLVVAVTATGAELIDILPAGSPTRCAVSHGLIVPQAPATDEERAGLDDLFAQVHAALYDEDFGMLPQCGDSIRNGQHDHMLIGRNEIGVQHVVRTFASALGLDL